MQAIKYYYIVYLYLLLDVFYARINIYRKMPDREDDHLTPATRLLEKRREMAEVEQALAAQKEVVL